MMADKETGRPYFTMSGGSCNVDQGAYSAATDLDFGRVPEEAREAASQQRENQAANRIQHCHVCRFAFTNMRAFENHAYDHWLGKNHNCSDCGKLFNRPWNLTRHLRTHGEESFKCGVCGKTFYTKNGHQNHVFVFHVSAQD
ncbi:zinc finger protein SNAI1-like [Dermacentor variabilis]|uniref:zinc finger protein SNAI1-like n=1 Tax=Dermacentor variabilis TaxID=34621 RepID=UPI003F5B3822